jgi:integrase
MARTLRDAKLDTRSARSKLTIRREPYWRSISEGIAIGYRKGAKGGTWIARHYSAEQGRRYQSIGTADDVAEADGEHVLSFAQSQDRARRWFSELAAQDSGEISSGGPYTVRECLEDYQATIARTKSHKTAADTRRRIEAMILPRLGNFECARLTTDLLQRWLIELASAPPRVRTAKTAETQNYRKIAADDLEAQRRRRATANRTWTILKAALNRAWRKGKITNDAAWRRVEPFNKVEAARLRYLTVAEAKRLINGAQKDFRTLVQGALVTGARYSELAALDVGDFNEDTNTVHVRQSKSGRARHVILSEEGAALFSALTAGRDDGEPLFKKADGSRWLESHQLRPMREAVKRAQIKPAASFHALRHTYASLSIMNGAPLGVIAQNLGHVDTRMVEKHYGHMSSSFVAEAIRAAAPRFGIKPERKVEKIKART